MNKHHFCLVKQFCTNHRQNENGDGMERKTEFLFDKIENAFCTWHEKIVLFNKNKKKCEKQVG